MKNFIMLLICFFAFNALADYGRQGASTNKGVDGNAQAGTLEQQFINVKNQSGGSLSAGQVVVWDTSNDDGYSVTTSVTAFASVACMIVKTCAASAFCKCQTYGYTDLLLFEPTTGGSASAGNKIQMSELSAGYVQAPSSLEARDTVIGMFYDNATTTGAVEAFIQLR